MGFRCSQAEVGQVRSAKGQLLSARTINVRNAYNGTARRQDPSALAAVTISGVTDGGNTLCDCSKAMEATAWNARAV